ncbi:MULTISPECIES: YesK family protein [Bacillus cereus group]|nr:MULTISPECIES: YesK family protein [Bacillus cereus group]
MMLLGPLLMALLPGGIILALTWWFSKKDFPFLIRMLPGLITIMAAAILFYIGFVSVRGFEGGAYGILSVFLIIVSIVSFFIGKRVNVNP